MNLTVEMLLGIVSIATSLATLLSVFTKVEHRFTKLETMQNLMTKILLDTITEKRNDADNTNR